jgi:hypothetical protein
MKVIVVTVILQTLHSWIVDAFRGPPLIFLIPSHRHYYRESFHEFSSTSWFTSLSSSTTRDTLKEDLLHQIVSTPSNAPTSVSATKSILTTIRELEELCPLATATATTTPLVDYTNGNNNEVFLNMLAGNWELVWTTQDERSEEWSLAGPFRRWIK